MPESKVRRRWLFIAKVFVVMGAFLPAVSVRSEPWPWRWSVPPRSARVVCPYM
jgi:hypothetical protein